MTPVRLYRCQSCKENDRKTTGAQTQNKRELCACFNIYHTDCPSNVMKGITDIMRDAILGNRKLRNPKAFLLFLLNRLFPLL